jgi:hypothetical protein
MDAHFSVFNCHVNGARERADREFVRQFGQEGSMTIFHDEPTLRKFAWVLVTAIEMDEHEELTGFYADPVDEDGNVIGTAHFEITHSLWPIKTVKIPASEMALPDDADESMPRTDQR